MKHNIQQQLPQVPAEPLKLRVAGPVKHQRLDRYLHSRFSDFSRSAIQQAIKSGGASVNGRTARPSYKVNTGDQIEFVLPEPVETEIPPENIPLDIIYEDEDIIVLNKQADMVVHPARGNSHGTLVNALVFRFEKLSSGLGSFRPGIVHRLDKNTTGIMVVTKNDTAQWKIAGQFQDRLIKKTYLAVVHGVPELDADVIDMPLGIHPVFREKYAIRPESGKNAVTFYRLLEAFQGFSLLELSPKTGRTHQLRVHLSYLRHSIVGDNTYGGKLVYPWQLKGQPENAEPIIQEPVINRPALHAHTLEFRHPTSGKLMKFQAQLPKDMENLVGMLRQYRQLKL